MINKTYNLKEDGTANLKTYILEDGEFARKGMKRPAIIVCPGGGYTMVSKDEGEPVAMFFNRHGYHAFVLEYSVKIDNPFPTALKELARAMSIVRENSEEWLINDEISVVGFSAGGNLALSLGIYYNKPIITSEMGLSPEQIRPSRIILGYPAVTLHSKSKGGEIPPALIELMDKGLMPDFRGPNIKEILLGHEGVTEEEAEQLNLLNYLHESMPPTFIWGSYEDTVIPASDLTGLAAGLYKLGVPCELHMFGHGPHGVSLCDTSVKDPKSIEGLSMGAWTELCIKWLKQ